MTQQHVPILDQMTVKPAPNGLVAVTVLISPDVVRDYCRFLETLADFFHTVDRKATIELDSHHAATQSALFEDRLHAGEITSRNLGRNHRGSSDVE